jgi:hypothetical protein
MTEVEWATCRDPRRMLDYHRMKKYPRRFRLLASACVRQVVPADAPPLVGQVIGVVEEYADGAARAEFLAARKVVRKAIKDKVPGARALANLTDDAMEGVSVTIENVRTRSGGAAPCGLIRCVFPLRPAILDPTWLTSDVLALARSIYDERAFDRMPILADALQDAGCGDEPVLDHCRGGSARQGVLGRRWAAREGVVRITRRPGSSRAVRCRAPAAG